MSEIHTLSPGSGPSAVRNSEAAVSERGRQRVTLLSYLRSGQFEPRRLRSAPLPVRILLWTCMTAVAVAPAIGVYRAFDLGLRPVGDVALMALKTLDVGTSHTPLIGQQTSVVDSAVRHPGPLQFWLFAPFVRLFGSQIGFALGTALVAAASGAIGVWSSFRVGGARFAVLVTLATLWLQASFGYTQLADAVSSSHGLLPTLAVLLLVAGVLRGDLRLLPLAAAVASYAFQTHLAMLPMAVTAGAAIFGAGVIYLPPVVSAEGWRRGLAQVGYAIDVGIILWVGPILDQLFGTRNLSSIIELGAGGTEESGKGSEWARQLPTTFFPPNSVLGQHFHPGGGELRYQSSLASSANTWLTWAAIFVSVGIALLMWRRRASAQVAIVNAVAVCLNVYAASNLSGRAELKANNYAWLWICASLYLAVGLDWLVSAALRLWTLAAERRLSRSSEGGRRRWLRSFGPGGHHASASVGRSVGTQGDGSAGDRPAADSHRVKVPSAKLVARFPAAALVVVVVCSTLAITDIATYRPPIRSEFEGFTAAISWSAPSEESARRLNGLYSGQRIVLGFDGFWSGAYVVPTVALQLEELGARYQVDVVSDAVIAGFGEHRTATERSGVRLSYVDQPAEMPIRGELVDVLINFAYPRPAIEARIEGLQARGPWSRTEAAERLWAVEDPTPTQQLWRWALLHPESPEMLDVADEMREAGLFSPADESVISRDNTLDLFRGGRVILVWRTDDG